MADRDPTNRSSQRDFYDDLADTYDLIYPDWDASIGRQAAALQRILHALLGARPRRLLDCTCGIGTQLLGLAALGEPITGTDLSPAAVARARREARRRHLDVPVAAADMRALPFADRTFDALICADNALPHLTTAPDLSRALREMARVLRPNGLVVISLREYDTARYERPSSTPASVRDTPSGRVITFQLWHWHDDGERYDVEHFQLLPDASLRWTVRNRTTTYWAITKAQVENALHSVGFHDLRWHQPENTGFFQLIITARVRSGAN